MVDFLRSGRLVASAVFVASSIGTPEAHAYTSGTGRSIGNCDACHRGGSVPTVQFLVNGAPATSVHVKRGQTLNLVFAVTPPRAGQNWAGFKVTSPFTLSSDSVEVALVNAHEVDHATPKNAGGLRNEFRFNVSISATEACGSPRTLTGWGSAVDRDGSLLGDGSAMATLAVTVDCPASLVGVVSPAGPKISTGAAVSLPQLSEADATRVLMGWLQSSNYYRMAPKHFAARNGRLQDRDWVFDLVLQNCPTSDPIDVWRVDSITKEVTRRTAGGVFARP